MKKITLDYNAALKFFQDEEIKNMNEQVMAAHSMLHEKNW